MKDIVPVQQQKERMDRRDREARRHKRRQRHVQDFVKTSGIQHRRDWVNIGELAINELEAGGRVHPRIGRHDENPREDSADRHNYS